MSQLSFFTGFLMVTSSGVLVLVQITYLPSGFYKFKIHFYTRNPLNRKLKENLISTQNEKNKYMLYYFKFLIALLGIKNSYFTFLHMDYSLYSILFHMKPNNSPVYSGCFGQGFSFLLRQGLLYNPGCPGIC